MRTHRPSDNGTDDAPRIVRADGIDRDSLDQNALRVVSRLTRQGHEAYLVGGCVRDLLLGHKPKDFDVATSAHPRQIKRLFSNGRIIGRRFRLVHVAYGGDIVETATFRREPGRTEADGDLLILEDNEYGTAGQDARRRDFTINALFLEPRAHRIIDYVGGLEDLEKGVLRTIGDPAVRMAEDPVRIMRAIKFATRLGFRIEDATWAAMCDTAPELGRAARPRILEEILRLLRSRTSLGSFRMLRACGALAVILPQIDAYVGRKDDPDPAAHDRAGGFFSLLEALDHQVRSKLDVSTAVCVATVFLRLIEREVERHGDPESLSIPEHTRIAAEVIEPFAQATRLSRRDFSRAARIVAQQRRFTQASSKRFRPLLFLRGDDFPDALALFRIRTEAWGQGWDLYEAWLERYQRAMQASPDEVETARRKGRRRRPRKRRSRRKGGAPD